VHPPTIRPFSGPESLRVPGEWMTFVLTLASLPITLVILSWIFQHQITPQTLALLLVVAMLYVAFARGRLLGGGLRVHEGQFAHVLRVVEDCARMLRMPTPHIFIRDDPFVPCVAVGIGDPYAIVISAQYIDFFSDDELRFLIGRELGHIVSGHTRYTSLLSANGRENAVVATAFGAWLRRIEYTADRVGLLCCASLDTAIRAIAVSSFGHIGRKIDLAAFAEQLRELVAEPSLRLGEWTGANPYSTNRIAALHRFARDPLYLRWAERFAHNAHEPYTEPQRETVYAGFWRRAWAFFIDLVVIQTIVPAAGTLISTHVSNDASNSGSSSDSDDSDDDSSPSPSPHASLLANASAAPAPALSATPVAAHVVVPAKAATAEQIKACVAAALSRRDSDIERTCSALGTSSTVPAPAQTSAPHSHFHWSVGPIGDNGGIQGIAWLAFFVYAVVLVGLVGQTFGMMVSDLRVTTTERHERVTLAGAIRRYVSLVVSFCIVVGIFSVFRRIQPFEKWSGTRLVSGASPVRR
jgi:Zn-dependent protease with chaperone function